MANLPQWINDIRVDSQAMLGAFLQWFHEAPPAVQLEVRGSCTIARAMATGNGGQAAAGERVEPGDAPVQGRELHEVHEPAGRLPVQMAR